MPYADQSDLLQRMTLAELTQLSGGASRQLDLGVVEGQLQSASGMVDSYLRSRYQTPLEPSDTVTEITADIAVYKLFGLSPTPVRESVRQRYEDALAVLKDISTGAASLDQPAGAPGPQTVLGDAALPLVTDPTVTPPQPTNLRFSDYNLQGFV